MRPGIDPKVDYAFKRTFGVEQNKDVLIDLLHAVLDPPPAHRIVSLELLNPFNEKDAFDDKLSVLDIKVRDQSRKQYNVEMQLRPEIVTPRRLLYYWAKYHPQQLKEGDPYQDLLPTVSICFTETILYPPPAGHHLTFGLWDAARNIRMTDDLAIHIIQLPLFTFSAAELRTPLDRWCWFLRHAAELDTEAIPSTLDSLPIRRAMETLAMLSQTDLERERYEARQKGIMDYRSGMLAAEQRGRQEGRQEGLIGRVNFCERLLRQPLTPADVLARLPHEELMRLVDRLEQEVLVGRS